MNEAGTQPSDLFRCSQQADQQHNVLYYAQPEEICAWAFEAFVEDSEPRNSFLVRGTLHSEEARVGLYPKGAQRQEINDAFGRYFENLGRALFREQAKAG